MKLPLALLTSALLLSAASTTTWETNTWQDFLKGKFRGLKLSRDGTLTLAPAPEPLFDPSQPAIWSAAVASDGAIWLGTGYRGGVYRVDTSGKGQLIWTAPQAQIFAVAASTNGAIYAASSPSGKVYRIENNTATEYFDPKETYIWSLAIGKDGVLYVGTGDQGKIYRVTAAGRGEVYYDSGQSHITALAFDKEGRLLAGSEPNGILYRVTAKDQAFVLLDAALPEIRSILMGSDGSLYVAALGGSLARKTAAPASQQPPSSTAPVTGPTISITVTDEAQAGLDLKNKPAQENKNTNAANAAAAAAASAGVEYAGVEKAAIYRIAADLTVETIWTSKEENVYDLAEENGQLLFATDQQGRIYRMDGDRKLNLIAQTGDGEVTRLVPAASGLLAVTSNPSRIWRLGATSASGSYESAVHDASTTARWGRLSARSGGTARFQTRSGNTARPDRTWSEWEAVTAEGALKSPNARYVQYRLDLSGGDAALVEGIKLAYLPQNTAPVMKSISVSAQTTPVTTAAKPAAATSSTAAYSITVTDTADSGVSTSAGTPSQSVTRSSMRHLVISWQAEDTDSDPLLYSLHYRADGEKRWKLLRANMSESAQTVDAEIFADGRYFFRVIASDKVGNGPDSAREAELVSPPILIDNTPPVIGEPRLNDATGGRRQVQFTATDATTELKRCEYSIDAGTWAVLEAADGVTDSRQESFRLTLPTLSPGEHVIVFRVLDQAGNVAVRRLLVE